MTRCDWECVAFKAAAEVENADEEEESNPADADGDICGIGMDDDESFRIAWSAVNDYE